MAQLKQEAPDHTLSQENGAPHAAPRGKMSYEEFLVWADGVSAEWVDGEVFIMSPASIAHQRLLRFLTFLLNLFNEVHQLGEVFLPPTQMKLGRRGAGREPDILFLATAHLDRVLKNRIEGPADLVVEIVSPESVERDRVQKYAEYEAAGVPEYWLLDPDAKEALFLRLNSDGHYERIEPDAQGVFRSVVLPGFWLRTEWLWQSPHPQLAAAREMGLLQLAAQGEEGA